MAKYKAHPAADIFPMMTDEQMELLKVDIKEHGQKEDIVLFEDLILDGRNRYRACLELGIEPDVCELEQCDDPAAYVISANLRRRHLTETQRAMCAARLAGLKNGQHKKTDGVSDDTACLPRDEAAGVFNVSAPSVSRALDVIRKGSPEIIRMCDADDLKVATAAKFVSVVDDKREQKRIAKDGVKAIRERLAEEKPARERMPAASLPDEPTEEEIAAVHTWLEQHDERPFVERFKSFWNACDITAQCAIRLLVMDDQTETAREIDELRWDGEGME